MKPISVVGCHEQQNSPAGELGGPLSWRLPTQSLTLSLQLTLLCDRGLIPLLCQALFLYLK